MKDKEIEILRYDNRAKLVMKSGKYFKKKPDYLNIPYKYYFNLFKKLSHKKNLLEIGSGIGENTHRLIQMKFNVCATDKSRQSVAVLKKRFSKFKNFSAKIADMEKLPFRDDCFDIICSAGSLSYGNNHAVMKEIYRVLKPNGNVIIIDSLNNNPIYIFNRYLHYLKGNRSKSTLRRMPDVKLINKYINKFGYGYVRFFGSFIWFIPLLNFFFNDNLVCKFSKWIDKFFEIRKLAFNFVLILEKKK